MNNSVDNSINSMFVDESYWSEAWVRHIENYLTSPPRCGFWLKYMYPQVTSILEIAGGSCRDSLYLSKYYDHVVGSDFDEKTLQYLKSRFPDAKLTIDRQDAFSFDFDSNSFDLSFSNGFWVLFSNNDDLSKLICEQARITKKYLVCLVHNAGNIRLIRAFDEKSKTDSLYNIRFFNQNEILDIVENSGIQYKKIRLEKFGGPFDLLLSNKIISRSNFIKKYVNLFTPRLYKYQPWAKVERIAVIVELT